jgi:hypothetical protein
VSEPPAEPQPAEPQPAGSARSWPPRRWIAEALVAAIGLALIVGPILTTRAWFDRHFLPVYFLPEDAYHRGEQIARVVVASVGLIVLVFVRPAVGRSVAKTTVAGALGGALRIAVALGLAIGASELALRIVLPRASAEAPPRDEPLRQRDPHVGWVFIPSRVGHAVLAGRKIDYAIDAHGYRVPSLSQPVDPSQPAILFAGESIITGKGLNWAETIPAQVGSVMNLPVANMSVFAYGDDQVQMRLAGELPRFAHPKAVVILFSPGLFYRDFDDERPHLEPGMAWTPAVKHWRLTALIRFFLPYHGAGAIDRRIALVQQELWSSVRLARAHGAPTLIIVPHFGPEDPLEEALRKRVLDAAGLPYVFIPMDTSLRIPRDPHPNPAGAKVIAGVITERLRAMGVSAETPAP